jgi:thiopeptide-type bacteriocin biosynthesis protein
VTRSFPPGSEWLYAKLYTGVATADRVLLDAVAPLAESAVASGAADRWFFIRYADPRDHLRVRFHGDPARIREEVLPPLLAIGATELTTGGVWKVQLDTYEREVERYGGPAGIELAEQVFCADSDAAVEILRLLESGDQANDERWRIVVIVSTRCCRTSDSASRRSRPSCGACARRTASSSAKTRRCATRSAIATGPTAARSGRCLRSGPTTTTRSPQGSPSCAGDRSGSRRSSPNCARANATVASRRASPCWLEASCTCTPSGCCGPLPSETRIVIYELLLRAYAERAWRSAEIAT